MLTRSQRQRGREASWASVPQSLGWGLSQGLKAWGRVQEGGQGWQPAPPGGGAHIHDLGGDGREGRYQHSERARRGEDLAAALVWEP